VNTGDGSAKTTFRADFFSLRTLLILAAGFALAVFLARILPGAALFHPAGQVFTKDAFITGAGLSDSGPTLQLSTTVGGFDVPRDAFFDGVDEQVRAQAPGPMNIAVTITYVVPSEGYVSAVLIRRRE
jgi:hypothetical protein